MLLTTIIIIVNVLILIIMHSKIEEYYENMYRAYGSFRVPIVSLSDEEFIKIDEIRKQVKNDAISQEDANWLIQKIYKVYMLEDHDDCVRYQQ